MCRARRVRVRGGCDAKRALNTLLEVSAQENRSRVGTETGTVGPGAPVNSRHRGATGNDIVTNPRRSLAGHMHCWPRVIVPTKEATSAKPLVPASDSQSLGALSALARDLTRLESNMVALERQMGPALQAVASSRRASARNLIHYIALRQDDLRDVQSRLSQHGLSSLGRSESCVMGSLLEVARRTNEALALRGDMKAQKELKRIAQAAADGLSWEAANRLLHEHTRDALGPRPKDRHIYIMVTAPSAKEADRPWMVKMLRAGMNVLRVNCAHETEREWGQVIRALAAARKETAKECRVLMDLAGPKIRTGPIAGSGEVVSWKPTKNDLGKVVEPARILVHRTSALVDAGVTAPFLRINDRAFDVVRVGDDLRFRDVRGKKRTLRVRVVAKGQLTCETDERAYIRESVRAELLRDGRRMHRLTLEVDNAPGAAIDVKVGDTLLLTRRRVPGRPPQRDAEGNVLSPGRIGCTLPAALDHLAVGHPVVFDDGRIQAVVEARVDKPKRKGDFVLRILRTQKEEAKLRAEKGINLPNTTTTVPSLTPDDLRALPFVVKHADAVSLSFVRRPEDVRRLHAALDRLKRRSIGVVLKIETRVGFENLPRLLIESLRRPPIAVMIARGDLAAEVGFERLAELQEEILWLCEAAHVPAIWATQVLDTLARTGVPSRAEVTDAAAGVAAECVMLNKGPFVDEAVRVLADILRRMEKHHYKKRSLFRKLQVSTFASV